MISTRSVNGTLVTISVQKKGLYTLRKMYVELRFYTLLLSYEDKFIGCFSSIEFDSKNKKYIGVEDSRHKDEHGYVPGLLLDTLLDLKIKL
jgi:hypothetical protein